MPTPARTPPREIREYYVPDFSHWKHHDAYQTEFEKLLHDRKTDPSKNGD